MTVRLCLRRADVERNRLHILCIGGRGSVVESWSLQKKHGQTIMMNLRWCIVLCISGPYGRLLLFGIEKKKKKKFK